MTGWFVVIYHRRTFTGWTGSIMGCERIYADQNGLCWPSLSFFILLYPRNPRLKKTGKWSGLTSAATAGQFMDLSWWFWKSANRGLQSLRVFLKFTPLN
jgi:hypothetical protein